MENPTATQNQARNDSDWPETLPGPLSVIVPTLNAAASLPAALESLSAGAHEGLQGEVLLGEILVVDGGSSDGTDRIARAAGARVLTAPKGRGAQLAAGAAAARSTWLLFLHADTSLSRNWGAAVKDFMAARGAAGDGAAAFRFTLDDEDPRARRVERLTRWRGRVLGLPYGDQGLLISRDFYRRLGGYRSLELMEDVDLVRRIGRRRLSVLSADAVTSAARYRRDGWTWRPLRNVTLLCLYFLGLPSRSLSKLYR